MIRLIRELCALTKKTCMEKKKKKKKNRNRMLHSMASRRVHAARRSCALRPSSSKLPPWSYLGVAHAQLDEHHTLVGGVDVVPEGLLLRHR